MDCTLRLLDILESGGSQNRMYNVPHTIILLDSKNHNSSEKSSVKSLKSQKKEESQRPMHHTESSNKSRRARSRSPIPLRLSAAEEINLVDESTLILHQQCIIRDEFNEEISIAPTGSKSSSDSMPAELRPIVSTSSLKDKSAKKPSEEIPVMPSVVKVINYRVDIFLLCLFALLPLRFCSITLGLLERCFHNATTW